MLFLEPVKDYTTKFPPETVEIIETIATMGFNGPIQENLDRINQGSTRLVENEGKFFYDGELAGFLRANRPEKK